MPVIANTAVIPQVSRDFHRLEIEEIDVVEERLRVRLRVRTPGKAEESFAVWMSSSLSENATFGGIVKAILGATPTDPEFDTDVLLGCPFRHMTGYDERGWPVLAAGTAVTVEQWLDMSEPPF
jgi:hypothetical protein